MVPASPLALLGSDTALSEWGAESGSTEVAELCSDTEKHLGEPLRQVESESPRREKPPVLVIKIP